MLVRVSIFTISPILTIESDVRRFNTIYTPKYLPRKDRSSLRQTLRNPRRPSLLQLYRKRPPTHRPFMVRLVIIRLNSLDCPCASHWLCYHGGLLDLSRSIQLSGRHISPIRKLGIGGAVFLSEYARRGVSSGYRGYVSAHDFCWGVELLGWCGRCAHHCAVGSGVLWTED